MVRATIWIGGTQYIGVGDDRDEALQVLNARWQLHCDRDQNSDRRQLSKFAEHIRYTNG